MSDSNGQPDSPPSTNADTVDQAPVLSYASFDATGKTVRVGRYPSEMAAALPASLLESMGIGCQILNSNVNVLGPYAGMAPVELLVHEKDADAAREILSCPDDQLEPADDPDDATPVLGDDGRPMHLVAVGTYDHIRAMRDAAAVLASARVRIFPPILRRRPEDAKTERRPFVLKVAEQDREQAQRLLDQARSESEDDDEPRCPKCNSWRVHPVSQFTANVKAFFGIGAWPQRQMECLACRYRGAPEEFSAHD